MPPCTESCWHDRGDRKKAGELNNTIYRREGGLRTRDIRKESQPGRPLISVITVVYNGAQHLEQSILSVLGQSYDNIEYLIVDGGSTDGTLDIINKYEDRLDLWISEPDNGIFDAMNKALDCARGDWLYFLGADDKLANPDTFSNIVPCLQNWLALVIGCIRYTNGRVVRPYLGMRILIRNTMHHQGAVYNARLFKNWRYDSTLHIVADYELNLLVYLGRHKYSKTEETIAVCGNRGVSLRQWETAVAETNALRKRHVNPIANSILTGIFLLEFMIYRLLNSLRKTSTV